MKLRFNRTLVALILVVMAVSVPCTAWYIAGKRAADEEAYRYSKFMRLRVFEVAVGLAQRLEGHFQALVESESRRPVYHYQPDYHDPTSNCDCASVTPSPLTRGPADPLILAHFQIDAADQVSIPTLPVDPTIGESEKWIKKQEVILDRLRELPELLARAAEDDDMVTLHDSSVHLTEGSGAAKSGGKKSGKQDAAREVWTTSETSEPASPIGTADFYTGAGSEYVYKRTFLKGTASPFRWRTVLLGDDQPMLVAVRNIASPGGNFRQGFVVSTDKVTRSMKGAAYPAAFLPGVPAAENESPRLLQAVVDLPAAGWRVAVNAGDALDSAWVQGEKVKTGFRRTFFWISTALALASICIVGLIWQADRLAIQRQRFSASAAHELRTPLAGLRVYGDMLADGLGNPDHARDYARQIAAEAERLGRVVSNVLGYTRLERGATLVQVEAGDLEDAVRECVRRFEAALEAAGARVEVTIGEGLPRVRFDRDAVFHIVQNLLDNAEKYSRPAENRTIHVNVVANGDGKSVELIVADHGPGVAADVRRQLFPPFTRTGDKDAPPGLGLGLTLVQKLAREHSGRVRYSEAPGGGAVFTVTFPVEKVG